MSVYMYLKINALGDYKKKYDPFARLLALKRGVGVCSGVGVVSGFYGMFILHASSACILHAVHSHSCICLLRGVACSPGVIAYILLYMRSLPSIIPHSIFTYIHSLIYPQWSILLLIPTLIYTHTHHQSQVA